MSTISPQEAAFALLSVGTPMSDDYFVAPVPNVGDDSDHWVFLAIRVDSSTPGDRITQPGRDGRGGGNLGHCAAFSKPVNIPLPAFEDGSRGELRICGKFAVSDATPNDWTRFGEDISEDKWASLRASLARKGAKTPAAKPTF